MRTQASPPSPSRSRSPNKCSMRLVTKGGPSTIAPTDCTPIAISSDSEPEPKLEDAIHEVVEIDEDHEEDPEEGPEEAPRDAEVEEEPVENPEEEEEGVEEHFSDEDNYADYL
ncbi:hypothetical protein PIB30_071555 [Stylosanthes scabra]|uniref:Uncharacterized protein n=1 Tax=Stylosanthes scabra TaxID=79078 RepID=A0ABU6QP74_9FABA|nr:hypothetical protein [Stylosanthes scabra]